MDSVANPNDKRHAWMQGVLGVNARLETVRAEALARMGRLIQLQASSYEAIEAVKTSMMAASSEYDLAYQNYAQVIQAAKQQAGEPQAYADVVVGLAVGILAGAAIEAVSALLAVEASLKAASKQAGAGLDPGAMRPGLLKLSIWTSLTQLHEAASRIGAHGVGSKEVDSTLAAAEAKIAALHQAGLAEGTYAAKQMEVDIWQLWMGSLAQDSDILDIDAIEGYLGPKGLRLVDFSVSKPP